MQKKIFLSFYNWAIFFTNSGVGVYFTPRSSNNFTKARVSASRKTITEIWKGMKVKKKKSLLFFWEIHQLWNYCSTVSSKPFTLNENCHFIIIVIRNAFHLTNTRNSHPQSPRNVPMSPYTFFCVIGPWEVTAYSIWHNL